MAKTNSIFPQILVTISASIGSFAYGTTIGWASPALPSLESLEPFPITQATIAWIGSVIVLGGAFACPVAGILTEKLGRKRTILFMTIPFVIGWLLIILADSALIFQIGRFITGFAGGTYTVTVPMYISEIAESRLRGRLVGCYQLMMVLGILFAYVVGSFTNWYQLSIICSIIPFILAFSMILMPESPHFLIAHGKMDEARRRLRWLRTTTQSVDVEQELQEIQAGIKRHAKSSHYLSGEFLTAHTMKPTGICLSLIFFQQLSGVNGVVFYAQSIFAGAGTDISASAGAIVLGVVMVVANVVSAGLVDRAGRRILLLISQVMATISLFVTGVYFYVKSFGDEYTLEITWLPLAGLIVFIFAVSFGLCPVSWIYMSEILPQNVKGLTTALTVLLSNGLGFIVAQFFVQYQNVVGDAWCWWTFSIISGFGIVFTYFLVPETRGKTLEEIQTKFHHNHPSG